jgi:hypothetical protein
MLDSQASELLAKVRELISSARRMALRGVNRLQVMTNCEIGRLIVESEQSGKRRAAYGAQLIETISKKLVSEFGRGFSRSNLEYMRRFFLEYRNLGERNSQTVSGILDSNAGKMRVSPPGLKTGKESRNAELPFMLSW